MPDCKKPELRIDWATHDAAKYAVENWHYSKRMPKSKLLKVGVWEDQTFIGVVMFGLGAGNATAPKPYGLKDGQVAELVRVSLRSHQTPVSRLVAIALRFCLKACPGLRLIVSFADPEQGHHGGIYQAGGWIYAGETSADRKVLVNGEELHPRTANDRWKTADPAWLRKHVDPMARLVKTLPKLRYLMPLDAETRHRIAPLSKPYPKRPKQATDGHPPSSGGATPTRTLQDSEVAHVPA